MNSVLSVLIPSAVRSRRDRLHRRDPLSPRAPHPDRASLQPTGAQLDLVVAGTTLTLSGELDLSTRDLLDWAAQQLTRSCADADGADVVIDASGLAFIDAAGLGTLVSLRNTLHAAGLRMHIPHASRQLRRLTALCQLDATLGLATTAHPGGDRTEEVKSVGDPDAVDGGDKPNTPLSPPLLTEAETR